MSTMSKSPARSALAGGPDGLGAQLLAAGLTCRLAQRAPVAQWIEHLPSKQRVAGSIPAGRAYIDTMDRPRQLGRQPCHIQLAGL